MIHQITDRERQLAADNERLKLDLDFDHAEYKRLRNELKAENERLQFVNEQIRLANLDCIMHFDSIRVDYEKLREAAKLGLEALDGTEALLSSMDVTHLLIYGEVGKAITALKEALGETK